MISVQQAREILSKHLDKGPVISVELKKSLGRVLAEDLYSPIDVPSFDNSAMDGYAMKFDANQRSWKLRGKVQAGDTSELKVSEGEAVRIFTGAKVPRGTDTVIPQEVIEVDEKNQSIQYSQDEISAGSNVRLQGSQCKKGELILKKGTVVKAGVIGLLASVGVGELKIYKAPSVAYIITGNELKEIGSELKPGEIYNSNGPMLEALFQEAGIAEVSAYKAADDKEALQQRIDEALKAHDILVLSGGISVGDYDFVKECLESADVQELFYKIKQRPGKPMFAGKKASKWIFALPGNPASVLSCFQQYVRPCLKGIMGHQHVFEPDQVLPLAAEHKKKSGFSFFVKAYSGADKVEILPGQQSFNLLDFRLANCLAELEEEKDLVKAGTLVRVYNL